MTVHIRHKQINYCADILFICTINITNTMNDEKNRNIIHVYIKF